MLYYFAMPNQMEILGYVSSNSTHWKVLPGKGLMDCNENTEVSYYLS